MANAELLTLNYNIGRYVSSNIRSVVKWGTGAIEAISKQLQQELPGVRGFSPMNKKYMRTFYEQWSPTFEPIRHLPSVELTEPVIHLIIRQLPSDNISKDFPQEYKSLIPVIEGVRQILEESELSEINK